jgi:hypothetical protein
VARIDSPESEFYAPWPLFGQTVASQWRKIRKNQQTLNTIVKSAEFEGDANDFNSQVFAAQKYGRENFDNKFRINFDTPTDDELHFQYNDGTESSPTWRTLFYMEGTPPRVVFLEQTTGKVGTLDYITVKDEDTSIDTNTVIFNSDDFYLTDTGPNKPVVNLSGVPSNRSFKSQEFTSSNEWVFNHNLSSATPLLWGTYNSIDESIVPHKADFSDPNVAYFYFTTQAFAGTAIVSGSGSYKQITIKETEAGGESTQTDTVKFDSSYFYIQSSATDLKPIVSLTSSTDVTASNVGSGTGQVFKQKDNTDLEFRTFTAGSNIDIVTDADEITISGSKFYGIVVKDGASYARKGDTLQFNNSDFDLSQSSGGSTVQLDSTVARKSDLGPGFYGVIFQETEAGGAVFRDDTLNVDSEFFYLTSDGSGKPVLSALPSDITQVKISTSNQPQDQFNTDGLVFNRRNFYLSSTSTGRPEVNFLPELDEKSITVLYPNRNETISWWVPSRDITVKRMDAHLRAKDVPGIFYPYVDWTVRYGICPPNRGTGTEVITGGTRTGFYPGNPNLSNQCDVITTFNNPDISSQNWVWFETTELGEGLGREEEISVTMHFEENS